MHLGDGACFGDCLPLLLCLGNLNPDLNEKVVIFYIDLLLDTFNGTTPINKCFIPPNQPFMLCISRKEKIVWNFRHNSGPDKIREK